ncbi:MAG: helix-turn-helix transcriptional regulator [Spiribacter salinus]|uniref:Helix-turn-helix transcriptional regulator n=1 Tax=Spiribacter salinus TaxID=1335746 RepID=A0A540VT45_9GAMM|nr:MAG: helix-turn-helix transcriptional regulator [Spiribacter salinus]
MGLTQEKLAAKLGVTFASVNRWENGKAKPSPLALKQIADLLQGLGPKGRDLFDQYFAEEI